MLGIGFTLVQKYNKTILGYLLIDYSNKHMWLNDILNFDKGFRMVVFDYMRIIYFHEGCYILGSLKLTIVDDNIIRESIITRLNGFYYKGVFIRYKNIQRVNIEECIKLIQYFNENV